MKAPNRTRPFHIQDGVGLVVDDVDQHVSLSVAHSALFVHVELDVNKTNIIIKNIK